MNWVCACAQLGTGNIVKYSTSTQLDEMVIRKGGDGGERLLNGSGFYIVFQCPEYLGHYHEPNSRHIRHRQIRYLSCAVWARILLDHWTGHLGTTGDQGLTYRAVLSRGSDFGHLGFCKLFLSSGGAGFYLETPFLLFLFFEADLSGSFEQGLRFWAVGIFQTFLVIKRGGLLSRHNFFTLYYFGRRVYQSRANLRWRHTSGTKLTFHL